MSKLGVCQRAMERSVLGVKLTDRVRNTILRSKTKITDFNIADFTSVWQVTCQTEVGLGRTHGRMPEKLWRDELDAHSATWPTKTLEQGEWKRGREVFAQQWDPTR